MLGDKRLAEIRKGIEIGQLEMNEEEALFAIRDLLTEVTQLWATMNRIQAERRTALSLLHRIYYLGIDPKDAHVSARAITLLDAAQFTRIEE